MRQDIKDTDSALRFFLDHALDGVFILDEEGRCLDVNEAACRSLQYSHDELLKRPITDVNTGLPDLLSVQTFFKSIVDMNRDMIQTFHKRKDGSLFPVEMRVSPVIFQGQRVFMAVAREISDNKNREDSLKRAAHEWQATVDSVSDAIYQTSPDYFIQRCNKATLKMFNKKPEEIIGRRCYEVVHGLSSPHPDCPVARMNHNRQRESQEFQMQDHCFAVFVDPICDENEEVTSIVHILQDVTERKRLEEERLILSKLESTGLLAGGLAHDFNNLLAIILGNIEIAQTFTPSSPATLPYLKAAEKAVFSARDLTYHLITFAKGRVTERKPVALENLLKGSSDFALSGSNVACHISLGKHLALVEIDENLIDQVLRNILLNARETMPEGGQIEVSAQNISIKASGKTSLPPGKYVCISITDHGKGIPADLLPRIFDPYFSTKERGTQKGMGLGLTICHSIIQQHRGGIRVESKSGVGTTFHVYLPIAAKTSEPARLVPAGALPAKAKILAMDDEELMRDLIQNALKKLGFEVELAQDGEQALDLYLRAKNAQTPFDLVILDLTVPGRMGGKEALKAIAEIDPMVRAIVSSGYAKDEVILDHHQHGFQGALVKPYRLKDLREVLAKLLS